MRCWKCGQELADGTATCVYCSAAQSRPAPTTEAGRAMRSLYERYGAQAVLANGAYLTSGLSDLVDDSKKLRNQLKMAMDAGVGRLYLEQLSYGAPNADFDRRVKHMLTEDAGLNDKTAAELVGYFDEMIGWRVPSQPGTPAHTPPIYTPPRDTEERPPVSGGNGGRHDAMPKPETGRGAATTAKQEQSFRRKSFYPYEWVAFGYSVILTLLPIYHDSIVAAGNKEMLPLLETIIEWMCFFSLLMSFAVKKENLKRIGSSRIGIAVAVSMFYTFASAYAVFQVAQEQNLGWEGLILFTTSGLLFLQMVRHRILESKLPKT